MKKTMDALAKFNITKLHTLLREEFFREEAGGFARLSQIPSTHTEMFLKYYLDLKAEEAAILRDALIRNALAFTCRVIAPADQTLQMSDAEAAAYKRYLDAKVWCGWKFPSLRWLTNTAGVQKGGVQRAGDILPPEVLARASGLKGARATELRGLVKQALAQKLGLKPEKRGGGVWCYKGTAAQLSFEVGIDYGSSLGSQMKISVDLCDAERDLAFERASFEQLMGLSFSDWDFILESQTDQKIALFADLVDFVVQFHRQAITICCTE